ncbi:MAG: CpsD/CapB family tyrosine-protein kinase [Deltaproteobacteria bacterium]|nr:CpsD/CapB family tyrosine-protein kinase [Deltaproteobacteria bacterium]
MSEIFKFLKQTGVDKEKGSETAESGPVVFEPDPSCTDEIVGPDDFQVQDSGEIPQRDPAHPTSSIETEIVKADKFELNNANLELKTTLDPLTIVGEQFRLLRTKLTHLKKEKKIKVVLVTSSVPEEGKTFASSSLAGVFAQEPGKRVVLLDCDMRKPRSGHNLGVNGSTSNIGMSEVLQGNTGFFDSMLKSADSNFFFMPSGPLPQNPTELLGSDILEKTIKKATDTFDWVIIDSPPVLALSDATLLAPLCDTVLLVVRANSTPSKLIKETIEHIGREKICGIVFNRQKQKYPSTYYYKYYYGKYKK